MKRIFASIFFLSFLLAACAPAAKPATNTPVANTSTAITPSITSQPPTATSTPSPTPIPVAQDCVSISPKPSNKDYPKGVLVLRGEKITGYIDGQAISYVTGYLFDLDSKSYRFLTPPGELFRLEDISPDRTKLLYTYERVNDDPAEYIYNYRLVISDMNGKILADFSDRFGEDYWDYYSWLNNDILRTVDIEFKDDKMLPGMFNPFTSEYTLLRTNWKNYYSGKGPDWFIDRVATEVMVYDGANILYDPTLTRVLYPQSHGQIALADVVSGNVVGVFQPPQSSGQSPSWGRLPRWSNNGEELLIILSEDPDNKESDEFYIVNQDGRFQRFTQITQLFNSVRIIDYAWSPDDSKVAFWMNINEDIFNEEEPRSNLAILDMKSGQTTNLCIQGISAYPVTTDPNTISPLRPLKFQPIWSPDGKQIMFIQPDPNNSEGYNVVIVDLEAKTAWIVDSNKHPIGWMVKEP